VPGRTDRICATCYVSDGTGPHIMSYIAPLLARRTLLLLSAAAATVAACGPSRDPRLAYHSSGLPLWQGHAVELFDDNIDPTAVGMSMEGPSPRSDRFLRERAQTADVVARVKVSTVTVETVGDESRYRLGVTVGLPTLAKAKIEDRTFELLIRPNSRAYAIARAFDSRLRGLTFVGFITRFAGPDGEPEVHWHLSADTRDVADAVKEAVALGEIAGS
jgi:hypothetical protein